MPELCRPQVPQGGCNVTMSVSAAELSPKESKRAVDAHISGGIALGERLWLQKWHALQYSTRLGYLSTHLCVFEQLDGI